VRVECEALEAAQKERDALQKLYNELAQGIAPARPNLTSSSSSAAPRLHAAQLAAGSA
jgi:hypothetical protein